MATVCMAKMLALVVLLSLTLLCSESAQDNLNQSGKRTSKTAVVVVIIGGKGDLAKRFLWPAIHEYLLEPSPHTILPYSASRDPENPSGNVTDELFTHIHCSPESQPICSTTLDMLHKSTVYVQVKSAENYTRLNDMIIARLAKENLVEIGRVFYLSVPSFAYVQVSQNINSYARPSNKAWLRVVLEKPFGRDLDSALAMTTKLETFFSEDEIVRIDHYLSKPGVQQIIEFKRRQHEFVSRLWSAKSVDYIEVLAEERMDVKGRSGYYNEYGAIRDMLQNHLTEIASLILLNSNEDDDIAMSKLEVLRHFYPPLLESAVVGQYSGYLEHLIQDRVTQTIGNSTYSRTPTFASVILYLRDAKWFRVPIIVTSGKRMGEKITLARVVFRSSLGIPFRMSSHCRPEIVFYIQGENLKRPVIFISHHFSQMESIVPSTGWEYQSTCSVEPMPTVLLPYCGYSCLLAAKEYSSNSYTTVIRKLVTQQKGMFVSAENLLESWRVWTPLLKELEMTSPESIFTYSPEIWKHIQLQVEGTVLSINSGTAKVPDMDPTWTNYVNVANNSNIHNEERSLSKLLGFSVHVSTRTPLVRDLTSFLFSAAQKAIKERGAFHIALPGGNSLLPIYQVLALNYSHSFPWEDTHIWQTDERCEYANSSSSNANQLANHFFNFVPIPRHQFHLMPTKLNSGLCSSDDAGPELYERELVSHLPDGKFDFVFLGLGKDGHIASLFPEEAMEDSWGTELVQMVRIKEDYSVKVKQRMTLTYGGLLMSRQISILTIGEEKRGIFQELRDRKMKGQAKGKEDLPVEKLLQQAKKLHLWVDLQCI